MGGRVTALPGRASRPGPGASGRSGHRGPHARAPNPPPPQPRRSGRGRGRDHGDRRWVSGGLGGRLRRIRTAPGDRGDRRSGPGSPPVPVGGLPGAPAGRPGPPRSPRGGTADRHRLRRNGFGRPRRSRDRAAGAWRGAVGPSGRRRPGGGRRFTGTAAAVVGGARPTTGDLAGGDGCDRRPPGPGGLAARHFPRQRRARGRGAPSG